MKLVLTIAAALSLLLVGETTAQSGSRVPAPAGSATRNVPSVNSQSIQSDLGSSTRNAVPMNSGQVIQSDPIINANPVMSNAAPMVSSYGGDCGCSGTTAPVYSSGYPSSNAYSPAISSPVYSSGIYSSGGYSGGSYSSGAYSMPAYSQRRSFAPSWRFRRSYLGGFNNNGCGCGW